jgi:hypothetical protein
MELIEKEKLSDFVKMAEDTALNGIWKAIDLNNSLIEFVRKDSVLNGISQKSISGWTKGSIIYKDVCYEKDGAWDIKPKLWQTNIFGYTTGTYYSKKKGMLKFLSPDTLKIYYERRLKDNAKNTITFIRIKEEPNSNISKNINHN